MKVNAANLESVVTEVAAAAAAWTAKANAAFEAAWNKELRQEAMLEAGAKAHAVAGVAARDQIHEQLNELCDYYLFAPDAERKRVRDLIKKSRPLTQTVQRHIGWATKRITSSSDSDEVRRALAAASMDDLESDFRDTYIALGELYLKAAGLGMEPASEFDYVSSISSDIPRPAPSKLGNTRDFLGNFKQSAFFASYVKPKLGVGA